MAFWLQGPHHQYLLSYKEKEVDSFLTYYEIKLLFPIWYRERICGSFEMPACSLISVPRNSTALLLLTLYSVLFICFLIPGLILQHLHTQFLGEHWKLASIVFGRRRCMVGLLFKKFFTNPQQPGLDFKIFA